MVNLVYIKLSSISLSVPRINFAANHVHTDIGQRMKFFGRTTGIEPATDGVTVHCLTTWLRPPDTLTISKIQGSV